jgi:MFS family permease
MNSIQGLTSGIERAALPIIETDVPARLDRLPWAPFHSLVVAALGITWILDGLEVTLAGSVAATLKQGNTLALSDSDVGLASSAYVAGAVLGALFFGWLTDRLGRRRLFFITLGVYMLAAGATGLSWNLASFVFFRVLTGAGIGGEYAAINSTIQELIPCRYRGWTDLAINGSFWVGAALGAAGSLLLLDPHLFAADIGWRLCFVIGAALSLVIFVMRLWLPESPRWLLTHGRAEEARRVIETIERRFEASGRRLPAGIPARIRFRARPIGLGEVIHSLFWVHRRRALVGLSLMAAQAFFYNAIFFTYALVLTDFYGVPAAGVGWYILPFAAGNFLGPLLLGHFFDTVGRKPMIAGTYILSGLLLAVSGYLFQQGELSAAGQTVAWMIVFFFASAAASSAYLTVSETFPLELRAMAIAVFYAVGTGLGGIAGPLLFGRLIETGSRGEVFIGYLIGAGLMLSAAVVLLIWGVAAERKPLESVARPLTLAE